MGLMKNSFVGELHGKIGDLVFANHKPGVKVVRRTPKRTDPPTTGELASQDKFRRAVEYAKGVWKNQPELKAKYNAVARPQFKRGFALAKSDFLRPPTVEDIDLSSYAGIPGEPIQVRAVDNFEVKSVHLRILDLAGAVLEEGAAVLNCGPWTYTATIQVPPGQTVVIEATATDHPDHTGCKRVDHACGPRP